MRHLQILAQGVHRKRGAHQVRQSQHKLFQSTDIPNAVERCQVLFNDSRPMLSRPATRIDFGASKKGFGKSAEPQQVQKAVLLVDTEFCY